MIVNEANRECAKPVANQLRVELESQKTMALLMSSIIIHYSYSDRWGLRLVISRFVQDSCADEEEMTSLLSTATVSCAKNELFL